MDDPEKTAPMRELGERLEAARSRQQAGRARPGRLMSSRGMGVGFRIAVELVAALAAGLALGLLLDYWLGTRPWLMIVGFILGSGAAFSNVVRTARQLEAQQKAQREARRLSENRPEAGTSGHGKG